MSERNPTLAEVIRTALDRRSAAIRVALPGKIESFNSSTQTASVKPQLKEPVESSDGTVSATALPVLNEVPVICLGGGDFGLQFPVQAGDTCLLLFTDRSIDKWQATGGDVDPEDERRHHLSDAVCIVGLRHDNNKLGEYDTGAIQLGKQSGPRVRVTSTEVHLGGGSGETPTDAAIKGTTYRGDEATMLSTVNTSVTTINTQVGIAAGALTGFAAANAIPIVGGAIASPLMATAVAALSVIASQLATITTAVTTFGGQQASHLSTKVKVK